MLRASSRRLLAVRRGWQARHRPALGGSSSSAPSGYYAEAERHHAITAITSRSIWSPSEAGISLLCNVHQLGGFPPDCLACSIVATTVAFRVAIFPLVGTARREWSRYAHINWTALQAMKDEGVRLQAMKDEGVRPFDNLPAAVATVPFTVCMFLGLQAASGQIPDASLGLPELATASPYILPVLASATFAAAPGATGFGLPGERLPGERFIIAAVFLPGVVQLPPAVISFLVTNNVCLSAQSSLLDLAPVKRYFDIGDPPEKKESFEDIRSNFPFPNRVEGQPYFAMEGIMYTGLIIYTQLGSA